MPLVSLSGVSVSFGERLLLDSINLTVSAGPDGPRTARTEAEKRPSCGSWQGRQPDVGPWCWRKTRAFPTFPSQEFTHTGSDPSRGSGKSIPLRGIAFSWRGCASWRSASAGFPRALPKRKGLSGSITPSRRASTPAGTTPVLKQIDRVLGRARLLAPGPGPGNAPRSPRAGR